MAMNDGILGGAPIWVWPLLAALLFVGFRATRERRVPTLLFYFLPLLGLIPVRTVLALPLQPAAIVGYSIGVFLGAVIGFLLQSRWLISKEGRTIVVAGEWFTLTVLMLIFWANFVSGTIQALSQDTYQSLSFVVIFVLIIGTASGSFLGRAWRIVRPVEN